MSRNQQIIFMAFFALLLGSNAMDLYADLRSGAEAMHLVTEVLLIVFSLAMMIYLLASIRKQAGKLQTLRRELEESRDHQLRSSAKITAAREQYSQVIRQQFLDWQLTASEQEIGWLLLKGLSFKEIAAVRSSREKTVRQQASEIYQKSGVTGRHAFAAWFFEDLLT